MIASVISSLALAGLAAARVQYLGVSIAGGDFGCTINGSCPLSSSQLPLGSGFGGDGEAQMQHFTKDNTMNIFRLPVSWQFLVNNTLGGPLNTANLASYDRLVQSCLSTGASCILDIHNYARWNGGIIGQSPSGPTDADFISLWTQLATKYAKSPNLLFELMNEPHDLSLAVWSTTLQKAITAIRTAGATQPILLPGTNFSSAAQLLPSGSGDALLKLTNPDGSTDNLLVALHKFLDEDNSGTHSECVTNNTIAFGEVATFLRNAGRKAIVTETGAAPGNPLCVVYFCEQNAFINSNPDVFLGLVSWGAGSFNTDYLLSQTPFWEGGRFVDHPLMAQCVVGTWIGSTAGGR
ncbi:glycoside hydrolase superfamily [Cercophora newfieldiana]|uniref:cellulase n=1 Tax=Cercophora newfieldiana TaxID=92897 RepID=A0AA39YAC2_9PEZI|nr:glycoside hydrolase superfamily [Cercophora newfieldiana]